MCVAFIVAVVTVSKICRPESYPDQHFVRISLAKVGHQEIVVKDVHFTVFVDVGFYPADSTRFPEGRNQNVVVKDIDLVVIIQIRKVCRVSRRGKCEDGNKEKQKNNS